MTNIERLQPTKNAISEKKLTSREASNEAPNRQCKAAKTVASPSLASCVQCQERTTQKPSTKRRAFDDGTAADAYEVMRPFCGDRTRRRVSSLPAEASRCTPTARRRGRAAPRTSRDENNFSTVRLSTSRLFRDFTRNRADIDLENSVHKNTLDRSIAEIIAMEHNEELDTGDIARIVQHALFTGFAPAWVDAVYASSVLQGLSAQERQNAADATVVFLAYQDCPELLDDVLVRWKNPNAADMCGGIYPALYFSVAHDRIENARVLLRHGADPLAERYLVEEGDADYVDTPWDRVFQDGLGERDASQQREDLLRDAIEASGRVPPPPTPGSDATD